MIYIHLGDTIPAATAGVTVYSAAACLSAVLGNTVAVSVAFVRDGVVVPLADGATGKLVAKIAGEQAGDAVLMAAEWVSNGSAGDARRYVFSFTADSIAARAALDSLDSPRASLALSAAIEWTEDGIQSRCLDFTVALANSSARGDDDGAPDVAADGAWSWLKLRLVAGSGVAFADDDPAKTRTITASGGGGNVDAAAIASITHAAPAKTSPADADEIGIADSAASWGWGKLSLATLREWLQTAFGSVFAALSHGHAISAVTGLQTALEAKAGATALSSHISASDNPHAVTKSHVGLSNVDDTSDESKPISAATLAALNDKADTASLNSHVENANNPHATTAAQIGTLRVQTHTDPAYYRVLAADGSTDGYLPRITTLDS